MQHYSGAYFCSKSNWDGGFYDCSNLVSVEKNEYNGIIEVESIDPTSKLNFWKTYEKLNPKVFDWLECNVKDQGNGLKGWCCGNKEYTSNTNEGFSLFFYRRRDALNFIKTWSVHKKPTETYNQNTYVKKKLNLQSGKLEIVKK